MRIDRNSRILLFAPHPDDEAIGTGGLLQKAAAAGARVHVVFATNGDDNPWPHRVLERRWKIDIAERMLWGMRRAEEALDALTVLGLPKTCAEFLHLPDQRITDLLLDGPGELLDRLVSIIEQTQPTLVVGPSPFDLHPDHSSLHLFLQLALGRAGRSDVEQACYAIHTRGYHSDWECVPLELAPAEQEVKRRAVLAHHTQMVLSRNRFLRYAESEEYWRPASPRETDPYHPVRSGRLTDGALFMQLERRKRSRSFARCSVLMVHEDELGFVSRWSIPLRARTGAVAVLDAATDAIVAIAHLEVHGVHAQVRLPWTGRTQPARVFLKFEQPSIFFDTGGWREIPAEVSAQTDEAFVPLKARGRRRLRRTRLPRIRAKAAR
ncbi:MAG: PIG-L family deacetylase [Verrucomicrobiota bacterium]|nr:PIG-L family deacetylase [Verrucomicrobiota bacterium]